MLFLSFFEDGKLAKEIEKSRINITDFKLIRVIGRGAFGEVQLVSCF